MLTTLSFPAAKEVTNLPTVFNIRSRQKGLTRSIGPPYPVHAKPAVLDQNPADSRNNSSRELARTMDCFISLRAK